MILKIVADDFGGTEGINKAIEILHRKKILFNAALLPCGKAINNAIEVLNRNPLLKAGLHFVLSEEKSFTSPLTFSNNGIFLSREQLLLKSFYGKIKEKEVEKELYYQYQFLKDKNIDISFINGHRHIHIFPIIRDVVIDFAKKNNLKLRITDEPLFFTLNFKFLPKKIILNLLSKSFRKKVTDININDYFISNWVIDNPVFTFSETEYILKKILKKDNNGKVLEYMVHPAIFSEKLVDIWLGNITHAKKRENEFKMLSSPEFINFIKIFFEKII